MANVSASPEAMMFNKPSLACAGVRPNGASIMPAPFAAKSAPILRVEAGIEVPKSINTAPSLIPAKIPSSPYTNASTTLDVVKQSMMISLAAASSLTEVA